MKKPITEEFTQAAKSTGKWIKENPIKSAVGFLILPFDLVIGAPMSIAITAGGLGYGGYKYAQEENAKSDKGPRGSDQK